MWAHFFLLKLSVIKNQQFTEYILKRSEEKFARCMAREKYKGFRDAHPISTKSHIRHQRKYVEHVNNQVVHHQNYYNIHTLFIIRPAEVLTIIHDKIDNSNTACICYAHKIKAMDSLFKLPVDVTGSYGITNVC